MDSFIRDIKSIEITKISNLLNYLTDYKNFKNPLFENFFATINWWWSEE